MIRSLRPRHCAWLGTVALALLVAGCGGDSSVEVRQPPPRTRTPTPIQTNTPTVSSPVLTSGVDAGSTRVFGRGSSGIEAPGLQIWSAGPNGVSEQGGGDDELLGSGGTDAQGNFEDGAAGIGLSRALSGGEQVYAIDTRDNLVGPPVTASGPTNTPNATATATPTRTGGTPTATEGEPTGSPTPTAEATDTPTERPTRTDTPEATATPSERETRTSTPTSTTAPPTSTPVPPTSTPIPPTATPVPPTATPVPPTSTPVPPTATPIPPTATPVPPTATPVPPTSTPIPPTATPVPPTSTPIPPTATAVPPTSTPIPPTSTPVPPTATPVPPTSTPVPPTSTPIPPTATDTPVAGQPEVNLGMAAGTAGAQVSIPVSLATNGVSVSGISNDIEYDADAVDVALVEGVPDCTLAPDLVGVKELVARVSDLGESTKRLRVGVIGADNGDLLPDGLIYSCRFEIAEDAPAGKVVLSNTPDASDPQGNQLVASGFDGEIDVSTGGPALALGAGTAAFMQTATVTGSLRTRGAALAALATDILFDPSLLSPADADMDGNPDCRPTGDVGTTLGKMVVAKELDAGGGMHLLRVGVIGSDNNTAFPDLAGPQDVFQCDFVVQAMSGSIALPQAASGSDPTGQLVGLQASSATIEVEP